MFNSSLSIVCKGHLYLPCYVLVPGGDVIRCVHTTDLFGQFAQINSCFLAFTSDLGVFAL